MIGVTHQTVQRCLNCAVQFGVMAALDDSLRPGQEPKITNDANALGLERTDLGFHFSVLTEFRVRLVAGGAEHLLLDRMLERFKARPVSARTGGRNAPRHAGRPGRGCAGLAARDRAASLVRAVPAASNWSAADLVVVTAS